MYRPKSIFLTTLLLLVAFCASAQQIVQQFGGTQYLLYLPKGYKARQPKGWPLMVFLHGSGQSGSDIEKVKHHGPPQLIEQGKKFPFIVVSPQNQGRRWNAEALKELIAEIKKKYRVDEDRVYLTGLSMGGYGTWELAIAAPELFAAIAPICGGGNASKAWRLQHVPVWCFHGAKDNVVPLSASQKMIDALKPLNPAVKFTIYPQTGHDSWVAAYGNDALYAWLLSHKRYQHREVAVTAEVLKTLEGTYVSPGGTSIRITANNGVLTALLPGGVVELRPASATKFFIAPALFDYIEFEKTPDGSVRTLSAVGPTKQLYRKTGQ